MMFDIFKYMYYGYHSFY